MGLFSPGVGKTARKTITFTGAANAGAAASNVTVFTVTGRILVHAITAFCTTDLTEAAPTATMTMGTVTNTSRFLASPTGGAVALDANEWWVTGAAPVAGSIDLTTASAGATDQAAVVVSENIIILPATQNINGGVLEVYMIWEPLSASATVA